MTDGKILIGTWKRICFALDCEHRHTAEKKCNALGVKITRINGVPHINIADLHAKTK